MNKEQILVRKVKGYSRNEVFTCGLCKNKIGGGKVSLVTHAVTWHNWNIKTVFDVSYLAKKQ